MILITEKYRSIAPLYDLLSAEWPVYRTGRKIGIDRSPDMLAQARRKATRKGWTNVILMSSPGASMTVVDMQESTGVFALATPLARAACHLGGAGVTAHPLDRGRTRLRRRTSRLRTRRAP